MSSFVLTIGGTVTPPASLTFSQLSYGRRTLAANRAFEITVEAAIIREPLTPIYDEMIREFRMDDDAVGHFHAPYEGATDYPTLDAFLLLSTEQKAELLHLLRYDLLRLFLIEEDEDPKVDWIVDSVVDLRLAERMATLSGLVAPLRGQSA